MTEVIAMVVLLAILFFAVLTWRETVKIHPLVNSMVDEYKKALNDAALVSLEKFREMIMTDVIGLRSGPPGPKGDKGDKGDSGP